MGKNNDLHGNAPDKSEVAVLLIDVINDLEFPGGEELLQGALPAARNIARLKERARRSRVPIIYVNDNFGKWRSDFKRIVTHCLQENVRGRQIAELLEPDDEDYFVLKPKHSGFFSTILDLVLEYLGTRTLVLTGIAGNNCVLFTANDIHARLSIDHSIGLYRFNQSARQRQRTAANAEGFESRYQRFRSSRIQTGF